MQKYILLRNGKEIVKHYNKKDLAEATALTEKLNMVNRELGGDNSYELRLTEFNK